MPGSGSGISGQPSKASHMTLPHTTLSYASAPGSLTFTSDVLPITAFNTHTREVMPNIISRIVLPSRRRKNSDYIYAKLLYLYRLSPPPLVSKPSQKFVNPPPIRFRWSINSTPSALGAIIEAGRIRVQRPGGGVQICQKGRRIGCVIPRCNLQRGITQPILQIF